MQCEIYLNQPNVFTRYAWRLYNRLLVLTVGLMQVGRLVLAAVGLVVMRTQREDDG